MTGAALAARPAFTLKCFTGDPATCTVTSSTSATLDTSSGGYAGVYVLSRRRVRTPLAAVSFSFAYACPDQPCVAGGSPRWSIPIDINADGGADGYAFIDAQNCGQTGLTGTVDTSCPVFFQNDAPYANWAAFALANPSYTVPGRAIPFVIADQPFAGSIYGVVIVR